MMTLGYAWFDPYDSVGYVLTLQISPPTVCPYLPIAKRAFFFCRVANFNALGRDVLLIASIFDCIAVTALCCTWRAFNAVSSIDCVLPRSIRTVFSWFMT